ncbi:MAG TPA: hypothetical protein VNU68_14400 [Verrucomicrobiae bacterium]|nr:hypothetical protein [Verrucomicrobiae bacterium]
MPKWIKRLLALVLLPVGAGAALALARLLRVTGNADTFWVAFLGGAGCWLTIFLLLPKPMWVYVFGHELTHALWAWLFGGRVKKFKVTAKGGHVVITKSNFLIVLAPYFFPLYVVAVVMVFALGHVLLGWTRHWVWLHFLVGAAYAFHITLTWHILQTRQSDITSQGYLFSCVVIYLGNISVLLLGLPMLTARVTILSVLGWWAEETGGILERLAHLF